jgi:hypothetical protein
MRVSLFLLRIGESAMTRSRSTELLSDFTRGWQFVGRIETLVGRIGNPAGLDGLKIRPTAQAFARTFS